MGDPSNNLKAHGLIVVRPRLFTLLDRRAGGAVWVHGPTGTGKSMLIHSYLRSLGSDARWVTLDARHRSLSALYQDLATGFPIDTLPVHSIAQGGTVEAFALEFFERFDAAAPPGEAVVFDDAQWLSPEATTVVGCAIEVLAGRRPLLIASHVQPDTALVPHVAASQLSLIGHEALAFRLDEAVALAEEVGASRHVVGRILERTAGWAAGVMLSLQFTSGGGSADIGSDGPVPLAALIRQRVLRGLSDDVLQCIRLLCELSEVPTSVAQAGDVWEATCAQIERLARRGLFVARTGDWNCDDSANPAAWTLHDLLRRAVRDVQRANACSDDVASSVISHFGRLDRLDLSWQLAVAMGPKALSDAVASQGSVALRHPSRPSLRALVKPCLNNAVPSVAFWYARASLGDDDESALAACVMAFDGYRYALDAPTRQGLVVAVALLTRFAMSEAADFPCDWFARFDELRLSADRLEAVEDRTLLRAALVAEPDLRGKTPIAVADFIEVEQRLAESVLANLLGHNENVLAGCAIAARLADRGSSHEHAAFVARLEQTPSFLACTPQTRALWQFEHAYSLVPFDTTGARNSFLALLELAERHVLAQRRADAWIGLGRVAIADSRLDEARCHLAMLQTGRPALTPIQSVWVIHLRSRLAMATGETKTAVALLESAAAAMRAIEPTAAVPDVFQMDMIQVLHRDGDAKASLALSRRCSAEPHRMTVNRFSVTADLIESIELVDVDPVRSSGLLSKALADAIRLQFSGFLRQDPILAATVAQRALRIGVESAFVERIVRSRGLLAPADSDGTWPWAIRIELLGTFRLVIDGILHHPQGKAAQKPLELLKYLASAPGLAANFAAIADALWPRGEPGNERKNVESTVSRLRKILRRDDALSVTGGMVALAPTLVWSDIAHFTAVARAVERSPVSTATPRLTALAEHLLTAYRGDVLQDATNFEWAAGVRETCRVAFVRAATAVIARLSERGELLYVRELAETCLSREPLAEYFYQVLIREFVRADRHADALRVYQQCERMLSVIGGLVPSAETRRCRALIFEQNTREF